MSECERERHPAEAPRGVEAFRGELSSLIRLGNVRVSGERTEGRPPFALLEALRDLALQLAYSAHDLRAAARRMDQRRLSPRAERVASQAASWCAEEPGKRRWRWPVAEEFEPYQLAFFESEARIVARRLSGCMERALFSLERDELRALDVAASDLLETVSRNARKLRACVARNAGAVASAEALAMIEWVADPWEGVSWDCDDYIADAPELVAA